MWKVGLEAEKKQGKIVADVGNEMRQNDTINDTINGGQIGGQTAWNRRICCAKALRSIKAKRLSPHLDIANLFIYITNAIRKSP